MILKLSESSLLDININRTHGRFRNGLRTLGSLCHPVLLDGPPTVGYPTGPSRPVRYLPLNGGGGVDGPPVAELTRFNPTVNSP